MQCDVVLGILKCCGHPGTRNKGHDDPALLGIVCHATRELCSDPRARLMAELHKFINQRTAINRKKKKIKGTKAYQTYQMCDLCGPGGHTQTSTYKFQGIKT